MGKKIVLFFIVLLLLISSVFALTTFVYNETDFVSLELEATDPDSQQLIYSYDEPLNENGEWQTDYGDSGEYTVTVTVSDGELSTSQDVLIIVNRKEEKPAIDSFDPKEISITIDEGQTINFKIFASDPNKDNLIYNWFIDDISVSNDVALSYEPNYQASGKHNVKVVVSDELSEVSNEWIVIVNEVDLDIILDSIQDVEIEETNIVSLQLPDFKKFGLTFTISDPIGIDNKWLTSYDDSGVYDVIVEAEGKGFSGSKTVKVTVNNKDRPPEFVDLKSVSINENEELTIELIVQDPGFEFQTYKICFVVNKGC